MGRIRNNVSYNFSFLPSVSLEMRYRGRIDSVSHVEVEHNWRASLICNEQNGGILNYSILYNNPSGSSFKPITF